MKEHIQELILPKDIFYQFVDKKVVGLMSQYSLLGGHTNQASIFSLHKMKMS